MMTGSEQGNPGFVVDTKTGPDILRAHVGQSSSMSDNRKGQEEC